MPDLVTLPETIEKPQRQNTHTNSNSEIQANTHVFVKLELLPSGFLSAMVFYLNKGTVYLPFLSQISCLEGK